MKLAVCNDWGDVKSAVFTNADGFLKSLQVLKYKYNWEVVYFKKHPTETYRHEHQCVTLQFQPDVKKAVLDWKPDAILFFCDLSRPILGEFENVKIPKAMCFTGGLFDKFQHVPDIILVESTSYLDWMKKKGLNVRRAFGTNTEMFKPVKQPKVFDAFFPATFASWKRHDIFAEAVKGMPALAAGYWQPHEMHCVESCVNNGVVVLNHQIAESMNLLYNMSRTCVITSDSNGGSQRSVVEAMACNIPVIVNGHSEKNAEFILESGVGEICERDANQIRKAILKWKDKEINTRDFILKNYSEYVYADQIKDAIESIL